MDGSFLDPSFGARRSAVDLQLDEVERLRMAGDYAAAFVRIERIATAHPKNSRALNEMGVCLRLAGHPVQAAREFRKARKIDPQAAGILANLGGCLRDLGEPLNAIKAFRKALELRPDFVAVRAELGETYHGLGEVRQAARCYELASELDPRSGVLLSNLASARAELGEFELALEDAERCFARTPQDRRAMAVKSFALHELGREEEAAKLLDFQWIRAFQLISGPGHEDLAQFNRELSRHVSGHPTLQFEFARSSTVAGEQTDHLLSTPAGPVDTLMEWIKRCVATYLEDLPKDSEHPYLAHRPQKFEWNVWGTQLGTGGHQDHHIHPGGWVSGVYYAQLPEEITQQPTGHAGWIQFGGAPETWPLKRQRPLLELEPQVGTVMLFPSYYYHRTLPFESTTKRISIAFDAMPIG